MARNRNQGRAKIRAREIGGPQGLEPTRFGDWERGGRCIDF
ncbi:MAG: succinate dehydrogenase assembly factor 4 [Gammaproteobacteria bacterium]